MSDPPLFRFDILTQVPHVRHGVSTRQGGVSEGVWSSLNVSYTVGDDTGHVDENLRRLTGAVGAASSDLFAAYQVHGRDVVAVNGSTPCRPHCDALVTNEPGRVLLLRFADCVPLFFADTRGRAVGVAHAGWRGTAAGVAGAAVQALDEAFGCRAADLVAGVGPSIGPCCYEVGSDVVEAFSDRTWVVLQEPGRRPHLDLWELN